MVSHRHKCIFIHIPKTGGQSFELAFLYDLNLTWKTRAPLLMHANSENEIGPQRLEHLRAFEYSKYHYVSDEIYKDYFKFGVVRNPWSRMFSFYKFQGYALVCDFKTFVLEYFMKDSWNRVNYFVSPQSDYLYDGDKLIVDYVGKFEEINEVYKLIRERFKLKNETLPYHNKSIIDQKRFVVKAQKLIQRFPELEKINPKEDYKKDFRSYYDNEMIEFVADIYKKDIRLFNYNFE